MTAAAKSRAVLVVNPSAGRLADRARREVVDALGSRFELEVHWTTGRDAAMGIAAQAAKAGSKLVIAFGGDGHVNEVANGVAETDSSLGIIPGGTMNVFARALGIPIDPITAIDHLLAQDEHRYVPLGRIDDRFFTFSAGCGFDAEAAERVERDLPAKRRFGEVFFYWSAFRVLTGSYRHRKPTMVLAGDFGHVPVAMLIASNAGPYAYLAGRPVRVAPDISLDGGLDVFALKTMRVESLPSYAYRAVVSGDLTRHRDAFYAGDLDEFEITSATPFHRHVDGEPLAPADRARFSIVKDALKVRA